MGLRIVLLAVYPVLLGTGKRSPLRRDGWNPATLIRACLR